MGLKTTPLENEICFLSTEEALHFQELLIALFSVSLITVTLPGIYTKWSWGKELSIKYIYNFFNIDWVSKCQRLKLIVEIKLQCSF